MSRSRLLFFGIIGIVLVAVVVINLLLPSLQQGQTAQSTAAAVRNTAVSSTSVAASAITLTINYGTEKERWFQDAVTRFTAANPNIRIDLRGQGSMDAYAAFSQITENDTKLGSGPIPALWSPAASIQVNLLNSKNQLNRELAVECKRLVLSPLVIIMWDDRATAFNTFYKAKGGISFANLYDAVRRDGTAKGKWEAIGGNPNWAYVKFGYTDPSSSNSGMMYLVALANNYLNRRTAITGADVTNVDFTSQMVELHSAVQTPLLKSTGTFTNDVIAKGPSSYDVIVVYEALAIENYGFAKGRANQAYQIVYPAFNLYSDHPMCLIDHPSISPAQRDAARKLQAFLLTPDIQALAATYGFRPSDPAVPIFGPNSKFNDPDLKAAGLSAEIGQEIQLPDGDTLLQLLNAWKRVTR